MDKKIAIIVSVLLFFICVILVVNLTLQWVNYSNGIELVETLEPSNHSTIITYSRAMDFAFVKTSTIFLGFLLVFVGALYLLRAHEVTYEVGVKNGSSSLSFQTASPGLVLVTLGVITVLLMGYNKSLITYSMNHQDDLVMNDEEIKIDEIISSLTFNQGEVELTPASIQQIGKICKYMRNKNVKNLSIYAAGDESQIPEVKMALGERRTDYLKNLLETQCSYSFLQTSVSYGEEAPDMDGKNKEGSVTIKF